MSGTDFEGRSRSITGRLAQMPALPQAAERLTREVLKDKPDISEAVRIIESDPALVSRVLRLVNSPYYGVRLKVSTVEHAVGLLGFRAVESLVVSLTVFETLAPRGAHSLDYSRHWQHSLAVAAAARHIAEKCAWPVPEEAYTAGILHDVGRAALDISAPEDFARAVKAMETESGVGVNIEAETLGLDHAEAGRFVLEHWNLAETLAEAIGRHHSQELVDEGRGCPGGLAGVVQAADLAAWSAGLGGMATAPKLAPSPAVRELYEGLDREALFAEMESELRRAAELFGVKVPDGGDIRKALSMTTTELGRIHQLQGEVEKRLAEKTRALETIRRVVAERAAGGGKNDVIKRVLRAVTAALGTERSAFFELDEESGALKGALVEDVTGMGASISQIEIKAPGKDEPLGAVIARGEPAKLSAEKGGGGDRLLAALGSREALCAPVTVSGATVGLLVTDNPISARTIREGDREILYVLAGEAGIAIENSMLQEYSIQLKALAETDVLTELANRRNLLRELADELQRARRYDKPISLVMIDIDHFKGFNDAYGHQLGDRLLKMLGTLLTNSCRNIDTPGRFGGEEFLVVLPETDLDEAKTYAERLRALVEKLGERLKKRYPLQPLTISVGITTFNPDADDLDSFVRRADNAMYSAKKRGRNRICAL